MRIMRKKFVKINYLTGGRIYIYFLVSHEKIRKGQVNRQVKFQGE